MQSDWYRHFFHGIALDFWRQVVPPQQTLAEADFLEQTLAPAGPARLIDVPSGNGRHTLALAARGHRMIAVDLADEFIREVDAHARAARALRARWCILLRQQLWLPGSRRYAGLPGRARAGPQAGGALRPRHR